MTLEGIGSNAKKAAKELAITTKGKKNEALLAVAKALLANQEEILFANEKDIENAKESGMSEALIDRLRLTPDRILGITEGIQQVVDLEDPVGEIISMKERPNGLMIGQKRVPLGVIGIIYESRPNVTVDAFALCFKTGNAVILRGGSDAIHSNMALVDTIRKALHNEGMNEDVISLISDTSRETAKEMMRLNTYIDVLIPRGGAGLIKTVVNEATIPVIETGTGNCNIYIHKDADLNMAVPIVLNAKLQRLGVCNACESLVIHKDIAKDAIKAIGDALKENDCEIRGDEAACGMHEYIKPATIEDYGKEYLDKIISVKIVDSLDEAIDHINTYSTGHSESIITESYQASQRFLNEIDSACVYVNASTRFTDGFEFGFGAEIGISTQKLHARGPMGLLALTTTKYIIYGNGQIR